MYIYILKHSLECVHVCIHIQMMLAWFDCLFSKEIVSKEIDETFGKHNIQKHFLCQFEECLQKIRSKKCKLKSSRILKEPQNTYLQTL